MGKGYGGTNSGMGGFTGGGSIRFSKMRGCGVGGVDAWRDQLAGMANSQGSSVLSNRARTSGTKMPKLHSVHSGTVVSMQPFGAFVQLGKGDTYKDGLLHVSCLCSERVEAPEEAGLKLGMGVWVKVCEVKEDDGKYGLDLRFVDQKDGKDLDPYQAKGRDLPDNHFEGAAQARRRRAPEEAAERPAAPEPSPAPAPGAEPRARGKKRKASDSSDSGDGPVPSAAEVAAKVEKMRRKIEKQKQKLEKARRKAEKKAEGKAEKKAGKKAKKDGPKRGKTSYVMFCQDARSQVVKANPGASFGEVGKMLGEQWKGMADDDKAPYIKQAAKDKIRYEEEQAKFDEANAAAADTAEESDSDMNSESE